MQILIYLPGDQQKRQIKKEHSSNPYYELPFIYFFSLKSVHRTIRIGELYLPNLSLHPLQYDRFQHLSAIHQRRKISKLLGALNNCHSHMLMISEITCIIDLDRPERNLLGAMDTAC
jgi:hypothetical protein